MRVVRQRIHRRTFSIFIFALTLAKRETKGEGKLPYRTIKNLNSSF